MSLHQALFPLLLLLACSGATPLSSGVVARNAQGILLVPSANCRKTCGSLTIDFPFGIGPDCFRHRDFELFCVDNATQALKLFLNDRVTEVTAKTSTSLDVTFSRAIPTVPGVRMYNTTWKAPGSSFGFYLNTLGIAICGFHTYMVGNPSVNPYLPLCMVSCSGKIITDWDGQDCSSIDYTYFANTIQLQFVPHTNQTSIERKTVNVDLKATIYWNINDRRTCSEASSDKANYACASKNSSCQLGIYGSDPGYSCFCNNGFIGNPYTPDGCVRENGYNPAEPKVKCSRSCGHIEVPFPFGLEKGCSGRDLFLLECESKSAGRLKISDGRFIKHIDIGDRSMDIEDTTNDKQDMSWISQQYDSRLSLYIGSIESTKLRWALANLTCKEAQKNTTTYACIGNYSECFHVYNKNSYVGYRCGCSEGFTGNPYVANGGCHDKCNEPGFCHGLCNNTMGRYHCSPCPEKTEYDSEKMMCVPKKKIILIGIGIGLGVGLGVIILILIAIFGIRRWRRDIQKRWRRKYFRKNHGLLLEQLISSDENASDKTKIFSLKELEKATNNFDLTRILGHGGHGMVYKGILSDQHVVAIKKSKVIEQGEIEQFINEVVILSQINHRNIVKLYGCCLETEVPLLVYDFIPNGSLSDILHSNPTSSLSLCWDDCLRIAAEVAGALYYLHSSASISVFHRDVKTSNILLDANYVAKVSDFGASRLVPIDQTHVSTLVQGTFGYLDPEYYHTDQLNEKSDVYSFGVLLLEFLLRRKPIFTSESGSRQNLSRYFLGELKEKPIKEMVAPQVLEEATEEEINNVASLAENCLRLQGEERPTMKEVEMYLQLLRTKRMNPHLVAPENEKETQSLLPTKSSCY